MFGWFTSRYHNCFTYPCAIVSVEGKLLDFNREFNITFDGEKGDVFSSIVEIHHDNHRIIAEKFDNKWELNYLQISRGEYHVVFFPYVSDNFLVDIPSPLAIIGKNGDIIHFNAELQKYFDVNLYK